MCGKLHSPCVRASVWVEVRAGVHDYSLWVGLNYNVEQIVYFTLSLTLLSGIPAKRPITHAID